MRTRHSLTARIVRGLLSLRVLPVRRSYSVLEPNYLASGRCTYAGNMCRGWAGCAEVLEKRCNPKDPLAQC